MDAETLMNFAFLVSRYLHIVATALLVGGTLFYELVVPVAIDDLKDEHKLLVFARARWAFRWIVWSCAIVLLLSGAVSTYRNWYAYTGLEAALTEHLNLHATTQPWRFRVEGAGFWWLAHAIGAITGIIIALALVKGRTPPTHPLQWMRINLVVLMVVILFASTTRHVRLRLIESQLPPPPPVVD